MNDGLVDGGRCVQRKIPKYSPKRDIYRIRYKIMLPGDTVLSSIEYIRRKVLERTKFMRTSTVDSSGPYQRASVHGRLVGFEGMSQKVKLVPL
jgi:hypothetical protein